MDNSNTADNSNCILSSDWVPLPLHEFNYETLEPVYFEHSCSISSQLVS